MPKPSRYIPYYDDIIEAMGAPGCAFCKLQQRGAERYIDALLWESVNDPRIRREVSAARGFCNPHAWLLVRPGGALSSAIIYKDVVRAAAQIVQTAPPAKRSPWQRLRAMVGAPAAADEDALVSALAPQQPCPVCVNAAEIDVHLCATVLAALTKSDDVLVHYRASSGLCLRHFAAFLGQTQSPTVRTTFCQLQLEIWNALDAELAEFIRKTNHEARGEKFGAERDAWERAIALTSGPQPAAKSGRGGLTQAAT